MILLEHERQLVDSSKVMLTPLKPNHFIPQDSEGQTAN